MIANEIGGGELTRLLEDIRRAFLMHRKVRLGIVFRLYFPDPAKPLYDANEASANMDFRQWLVGQLPDQIKSNRLFRRLIQEQERLIQTVSACQDDVRQGVLQVDSYRSFLCAQHRFDQLTDRFISGITTLLTDVDELTGLLNRKAMEQDLDREQAQARRNGDPFTIAMVDADHFKKVNDNYGHNFGDEVLEILAERFVESLRPSDRVYRYGGEEFLVLLPNTSLETARPVLERLRSLACAYNISDGDFTINQTVSIGATEVDGNEDIEAAVERADQALYRAKEAGRNRVELDARRQSHCHPE